MERYTVSLDGTVKANGLSFKDAIRVATDLNRKIGYKDASKRVLIKESTTRKEQINNQFWATY